jgi:sugar lactone lactonase YvrE
MFSQSHSSVSSGPANFFANASYTGSANIYDQDGSPLSVSFDANGTIMVVYGDSGKTAYRYDLSTPWDASTAKYSGADLYIPATAISTATALGVTDVVFSPDGYNFYVLDSVNKKVHQHTLTVAWDLLSGVQYNGAYLVGNLITTPQGLSFSSDGTQMYVNAGAARAIFQYTLLTAWDVNSAVYYVTNFSVNGQDTPVGVFFDPSGTKMYMAGVNDSIFQYSLSTAWDVNSAVYYGLLSVTARGTSVSSLAFDTTGTIMYVLNGVNVDQYTLSSSWNVQTGVYSSTISVSTKDTSPQDIYFSSDGSKMYIAGYIGKSIYQYNLTTAWSVATAVYSTSISTATYGSVTGGIMFDSTGTKMYIGVDGSIYQYSLSTAWSLSASVYDNVFFIGSAGDCMRMNQSGTMMYSVMFSDKAIFQYSLTTAWDVSTSVYVNRFYVGAPFSSLAYGGFDPTGTRMYIIDGLRKLFQYSMSPAWLVSSVSYTGKQSVINVQDTSPQSVAFDSTGSIMYVVGATNKTIYQYSLSTPFDASTSIYSNILLSVSTRDSSPCHVAFDSTGTKMYVLGYTSKTVYQYTLSTAWNISTATFTSSFLLSAQDATPRCIAFSADGTKMYMLGTTGSKVYQYTLSTAWSVSTAVLFNSLVVPAGGLGFAFNSLGTKMYAFLNGYLYEYTLLTPWNVANATIKLPKADTSGQDTGGTSGIKFNTDGTRFFVAGQSNKSVYQYNLTSAWNINTAVYNSTMARKNDPTGVSRPALNAFNGMDFSKDGTVLYMIDGNGTGRIDQYSLSTAWFIGTGAYVKTVTTPVKNSLGLNFNPTLDKFFTYSPFIVSPLYVYKVYQCDLTIAGDITTAYSSSIRNTVTLNIDTLQRCVILGLTGTKIYVVGATGKKIYQYTLTTPWDLSSLAGSVSFSVTQDTAPVSLTFSTDGTKMYVVGATNKTVYHYNLSTAWDVTTAVYSTSKLVSAQDATPLGVSFDLTGTTMLVVGGTNKKIFQYSLSTAWSVSSAVYVNSFDVTSQDTQPNGIALSADNKNMYVTGTLNDKVYQYKLT